MGEYSFQKIPYGPDSTPEIQEAIRSRVSLLEDKVILLDEIPVVSPFSIRLVFAEMTKLSEDFTKCAYLVDVSNTSIPDAETRGYINMEFKNTLHSVKHVAFVTGKNFIINTAARFVMFQTNLESFSINKTREEALVIIKKVLND